MSAADGPYKNVTGSPIQTSEGPFVGPGELTVDGFDPNAVENARYIEASELVVADLREPKKPRQSQGEAKTEETSA